METRTSRLRTPAVLAGLLLAPACTISPSDAVYDLAQIHEDKDGVLVHKQQAALSLSPTSYEVGYPIEGYRVGENQVYEITDAGALEMDLLDRISAMNPGQVEVSLEATAWLSMVLLYDENQEARIRAAAVLSQFAGHWIEHAGARLDEVSDEGDLAAAVTEYVEAIEAVDDPDQVERVRVALEKVDRAPIDDPLVATRLVAGMARRLRSGPLKATGRQTIERTGVRAVLITLDAGSQAEDQKVAEACRLRYDLLMQHAYSQ